ncbi:MAG: hypothetical protein JWN12_466 [Candidatus Saccharibacteria bacterium]|nr:hypothetical protein [Candidatus Saccharibacteria bacterium]
MKIKQTIKTLVVSALLLVSSFALIAPTNTFAQSCGGVQTSIISCAQSGSCPDGGDPYEGTKPSTDKDKTTYKATYNHDYGFCSDGSIPSKAVTDTGVWGILLLAINILTAGVGIAAIGGIVYGAILYTSAGGSPEQVKKAMGIITNVVIGVIAYALMFSGLNFLIPGGLFN